MFQKQNVCDALGSCTEQPTANTGMFIGGTVVMVVGLVAGLALTLQHDKSNIEVVGLRGPGSEAPIARGPVLPDPDGAAGASF